MRITAVIFTILTVSSLCPAQAEVQFTDPNAPVTVQDYLRYAALQNAGLESSFEQFNQALAAIDQAGVLPDPQFTYAYFIEEVETRVGPQKQKLGIMQKFPWFGKLQAQTDAAGARAKAAEKNYQAAKFKLFYQVKDAFYEYVYLARSVETARQNLELLKHFEQVARTKYRTSTTTHPDIIRAQLELAILEDKLKSIEEMRQPITARLNSAINRPVDRPLPWPVTEPFELAVIETNQLLQTLHQHNPELASIDFQILAAKAQLTLAEKKQYPDITLGVDWIQTDRAMYGSPSDSGTDPVIAMISINLPIWTDSYNAAKSQARAALRTTRAQRQQKENDLATYAVKVIYDFQDSARKMVLYRDTLIPMAKEMLQASESAYQAGSVDFLNLVDAQRKVLAFELQYEFSIKQNLQKLAELEMLAGQEISKQTGSVSNIN